MRERSVTARSVSNGDTDFKDALTGQVIDKSAVFIEKRVDELLADADDETLRRLDITPEARSEMIAEAKEFTVDMADLWASIDEITPKILATSDEEIEREYQNPDAIMPMTRHVYNTETTTVQQKMLDDWVSEEHWGNPKCYCAPAAVAFIVIGLRETSGYSNYPSTGWTKPEVDKVYNYFQNKMGKGPKLFKHIDKAMRDETNYKIEKELFHKFKWGKVNDHLKNHELPVISLRMSAIDYRSAAWHYRVIIGTRTDRIRKYHKFSWWWFGWKTKYWTKDKYKYWYYMHDNGSDGGNFWEKSGRIFQVALGFVNHK